MVAGLISSTRTWMDNGCWFDGRVVLYVLFQFLCLVGSIPLVITLKRVDDEVD